MRRRILALLSAVLVPGWVGRLNREIEMAELQFKIEALEEDDEVEWIREAIDIHDLWAERLRLNVGFTFEMKDGQFINIVTPAVEAIVGDVEHHKRWAERYRKMLERRSDSV